LILLFDKVKSGESFEASNFEEGDGMRQGWPLLVIFYSVILAACAGTNLGERSVPAASGLDYLDRQKVELQSCLGSFAGTEIERRESSICITMGCDTLFESNSDRIKPAICTEIDTVAEVVKKYPETKIIVDAHTDCIRSEEENLALSDLQEWTIKKALVDKGVAPSRVTARGWGESKPVASNATEAGRKVNRRITIMLTTQNQP
jgi:outer membrane protein OmpA-like peptidoglycan-associated protein